MGILSNLEPKEVLCYFEELCNIPHASYKEEKISDYCVCFAKEHGLKVIQDELKNVIIFKSATKGYEEVPTLILQGHLDMVCEKTADSTIDFERDGLKLVVEGDFVYAQGTTLGGDDGIAVAYILALLASETLEHPAIEAVFTVSEEVGMEGAAGIDISFLKGRKLLNIDSEEEGTLLTSCAGGARVVCSLDAAYEKANGSLYEITLEGLTGGHSGVEIHKGRANANVLLGRLLFSLEKEVPYRLVSIEGGLKDNAIPRESRAVIVVTEADEKALEAAVSLYGSIFANEYGMKDPHLQLRAEKKGRAQRALTEQVKQNILILQSQMPNGVQSMSAHVPGLVETSLNLGIVKTEEEGISFLYAVRSSVETSKEYLIDRMRFFTGFLGGRVEVSGNYPGWEYNPHSSLREDCVRVYEEMYGEKPKIEAIHAGLECGLLSDKLEGLDCISFGPDIFDIHTTQEKLSLSSVQRVWEYIIKLVAGK